MKILGVTFLPVSPPNLHVRLYPSKWLTALHLTLLKPKINLRHGWSNSLHISI
uniref:Uncharacterized protein n=1 Tax=Anguilla anguilla TaxID=7936 RepID=A0A0E9TPH0_ANGAN